MARMVKKNGKRRWEDEPGKRYARRNQASNKSIEGELEGKKVEGEGKTKKDGTKGKGRSKNASTVVKEGRKQPGNPPNPRSGRVSRPTYDSLDRQMGAGVGGSPQGVEQQILAMMMGAGAPQMGGPPMMNGGMPQQAATDPVAQQVLQQVLQQGGGGGEIDPAAIEMYVDRYGTEPTDDPRDQVRLQNIMKEIGG